MEFVGASIAQKRQKHKLYFFTIRRFAAGKLAVDFPRPSGGSVGIYHRKENPMQLEILRWIQRFSHPALDVAAEFLTMLGEPVLIAVLFCALYWCHDKKLGEAVILTMMASLCLNGILKDFFALKRPIGEEGIVSKRVETATGYAFPSGHTQSATAFWTPILLAAKGIVGRVLPTLIILCVGWSRLYLGVHYPRDVLGGIAFGVLVTLIMRFLLKKNLRGVAIALCLFLAAVAILTGKSEDTMKSVGLTVGAAGGLLFERRYVKFTIPKAAKTLLLRLAVGLAIIGILYALPKLLLPDTAIIGAIRYGVVAFVAVGLYPLLFTNVKLPV
jgi:membrane-associated phospholipid phosphatase